VSIYIVKILVALFIVAGLVKLAIDVQDNPP